MKPDAISLNDRDMDELIKGFVKGFKGLTKDSSIELSDKAFKLSWSHNIALLKDNINDDERGYYLNRAIADEWTVKEIERQIKDNSYNSFLNEIEQNSYQFWLEIRHPGKATDTRIYRY